MRRNRNLLGGLALTRAPVPSQAKMGLPKNLMVAPRAGPTEANGGYAKITRPADAPAFVGQHLWAQEITRSEKTPLKAPLNGQLMNYLFFDTEEVRWRIGPSLEDKTRDLYMTDKLDAAAEQTAPTMFPFIICRDKRGEILKGTSQGRYKMYPIAATAVQASPAGAPSSVPRSTRNYLRFCLSCMMVHTFCLSCASRLCSWFIKSHTHDDNPLPPAVP